MSAMMSKHKLWLIPICVVVIGAALFLCWQQLHAQNPMSPAPPAPAAPGPTPAGTPAVPPSVPAAEPAPPPAEEPLLMLNAMVPGGIKVMRIKNWDGAVTEMLRFKYKTSSGFVSTVHLPGVYKSEKRTKAGWYTLFQVFAMDREAQIDAFEKVLPEMTRQMQQAMRYLNQFMGELGAQLQQAFPTEGPMGEGGFTQPNIPGYGMEGVTLPPLIPGMP